MRWAVEEYALVLTGVLYFAVLGLPTLGKATLSRGMRWLILCAGLVFVGASVVLAAHPRYPATLVAWTLPLVPVITMVGLVREYSRDQAALAEAAGANPAEPTPPAQSPASEASAAQEAHPADWNEGAARDAADLSSSAEHLADLAYAHPELHTLLAVNPSTPASVLEWMASLGDPIVTGAIGERASHE